MKQVVLNIPDNKYPFFMELIKSLGFVKVTGEAKLSKSQQKFVEATEKSIQQIEHMNLLMDMVWIHMEVL